MSCDFIMVLSHVNILRLSIILTTIKQDSYWFFNYYIYIIAKLFNAVIEV